MITVLLPCYNAMPYLREALESIMQQTYTNLEIEKTYNYGDADHEPFLDKGMPGALLIEADWDNYKYIHTANDLLVFQNIPFAIQVLRLATAMLAIESVASFR